MPGETRRAVLSKRTQWLWMAAAAGLMTVAACPGQALAQTQTQTQTRTRFPPQALAQTMPRSDARLLPRAQLVDHLVRLAEREWRQWGRTTIDARDGGVRIGQVGATETDRDWRAPRPGSGIDAQTGFDAASRVRRYWHEGLGVAGRPSRDGIDIDTAARTEPWSAVFVSWLMRSAGVAETSFPATDRHADYLRAASQGPQFEALSSDAVALSRGDLICAPRDSSREPGWIRLQSMRLVADLEVLRASHCDLVVGIDRRNREARLIGGNVADSVAMTRVSLTADGRAIRTLERPFFVLLRSC